MFGKKDNQVKKPIEKEIAELQRKFRQYEHDKRTSCEKTQSEIRTQRQTIETLTRENKKMQAELAESRGASGTAAEHKMAVETINKLGTQKDGLEGSVQDGEDENADLTNRIKMTQKKIMVVREEMSENGGVNAALDSSRAVQKQIRILENRLDKALQKFNEAIAANKALREHIDTLRRERLVFNDIHNKLENELQHKKKEMASIIDQANAAYEARDNAQNQMAALKQQADKEHAEFEKEWKELGHLIEKDKRMKMIFKMKATGGKDEKAETAKKEDERQRKKATHRGIADSQRMTMTSESWAGGPVQTAGEKVATLEEAFAKIQSATGICDIDELVKTFIDGEDQNFGLFKYNNLLRADIEKLEEQISGYKEEYIQLSGTSNRKEDTEKLKDLEMLQEKWDDIVKKADAFDFKYHSAQTILTQMCSHIDAIFLKLQCTAVDLPSGCGNEICEANMMAYLAVIEQRTNELLKLYDAVKGEDEDEDDSKPPRPLHSSATLQIRLPSTVEDNSDDEDEEDQDDERPFMRDELKSKILKGISKKQQKKSRLKNQSSEK